MRNVAAIPGDRSAYGQGSLLSASRGKLPRPPAGFAYLQDVDGRFLVDYDGAFLLTEIVD